MAHLGATIEQPAKQTGFGPALAAAALVVVIGLVVAMGAWLIGSNLASRSAATDRSYTQIENLRGATTLPAGDSSLNKVEDIRGGAFLPGAKDIHDWTLSGASVDIMRMPPPSSDAVGSNDQETRGLHGALP